MSDKGFDKYENELPAGYKGKQGIHVPQKK